MSTYTYQPLASAPHAIRLLRLLPNQDEAASICCELFEYSLEGFHLYRYDALSYVWGNPDETLSVAIDGHRLDVTLNLYAALSRLRHHSFARLLWIDAICINQRDQSEKEQQIQYMTTIYSQANFVIVWLGEAANDSDLACERIRNTASKTHTDASDSDEARWAECQLLARPWFRRIWILQEVAAARDVIVMCGQQMIDRDAFCLGVGIDNTFRGSAYPASLTRRVCSLMKQSIPVAHYLKPVLPQSSLGIHHLGELVEMYFTHEATKQHDKVYALLGMCSDDLRHAGLLPDYQLPWNVLLQRLVKHLISEQVSIETRVNRQIAVIRSKVWPLGKVTQIAGNHSEAHMLRDQYEVLASFTNVPMSSGELITFDTTLTIKTPPFTVFTGDLICLLQGSPTCAILRPCRDFLEVVMISFRMPETLDIRQGQSQRIRWPAKTLSDFPCERETLLVWKREVSVDLTKSECSSPTSLATGVLRMNDFEEWTRTNDWEPQEPREPRSRGERHLIRAIQTWNVALILGHITQKNACNFCDYSVTEEGPREAVLRYQAAVADCEIALTEERPSNGAAANLLNQFIRLASHPRDGHSRETLLLRAVRGGHNSLITFLLKTGHIDVNSSSTSTTRPIGQVKICDAHYAESLGLETPLLLASRQGHESTVRLLLEADGIDVSKGNPLLAAASEGHEAIVKHLLRTGRVDVNARNAQGETPLWWAARTGHEAIARSLLDSPGINVDAKSSDNFSSTPLFQASQGGHHAIVKLLLETGQVQVDTKTPHNDTPLLVAAKAGHEDVVKMLLNTGRINVNQQNDIKETPLLSAAYGHYSTIVKLLLETSKVDVDQENALLRFAAITGDEALVKLLLDTTKFDVNRVDTNGSALHEAAWYGNEIVAQVIIETGKADVNLADQYGDTPLHTAAFFHHEKIARVLLSTGNVNLDQKNYKGETSLDRAKDDAMIKLLCSAHREQATSASG